MAKKRVKYAGALAKPIDLLRLPDGDPEHAVMDEFQRRIALLVLHFGIDPALPPESVWFQLAVRLAFAHVPGFGIQSLKRKGAKRKWTPEERRALVDAVNAQKKGAIGRDDGIGLFRTRTQQEAQEEAHYEKADLAIS